MIVAPNKKVPIANLSSVIFYSHIKCWLQQWSFLQEHKATCRKKRRGIKTQALRILFNKKYSKFPMKIKMMASNSYSRNPEIRFKNYIRMSSFHFILPSHFVCKYPKNIGSNEIRDTGGQESNACKFMKRTLYQCWHQAHVRKPNNHRHHSAD